MTEHLAPAATTEAADLRRLLAAVLDALDIPNPATFGDRTEHDQILNHRVMYARIVLHAALDGNPADLGWHADYLAARLTEHPPTGYRHYGTEAGQ